MTPLPGKGSYRASAKRAWLHHVHVQDMAILHLPVKLHYYTSKLQKSQPRKQGNWSGAGSMFDQRAVVKAAFLESRRSRAQIPLWHSSFKESNRGREVACSTSDRQGSDFEFCVWRAVSSHSSHHPQEVFLAQFSLHVHKVGLKPH